MATVADFDPRYPLEACDKKEDAVEWMMYYGAILRKRGLTRKYGVYIKRIPRKSTPSRFWPWGVYVDKYDA